MELFKVEIINFSLLGYGFSICFFKWNYDPINGDGSIAKYNIEYINNKYINPSINFTFNYNYDLKFVLKLNRG